MKTVFFITALFVTQFVFSQTVTNVGDLQPEKEYDNIQLKKINTNKNSTSFVIWIKKGVKAHKHVTHHESLYILSGTGDMTIDGKVYSIKKGDYFVVPKNTSHSLIVTSKEPMKVISVQAPAFFGKDRIFIEADKK